MTERELFTQWVKKEHAHIFNGAEQGNDRFKMDIDFMYMAWCASSNRKGYKLVPLEPTQGMIEVGRDMLSADFGLGEVYRAMIGATND